LTVANITGGSDGAQYRYNQQGTWLRLDKLRSTGNLNESFHYCFDLLMTLLYLDKYPDATYVNTVLGSYRFHDSSKTVGQKDLFAQDRCALYQYLLDNNILPEFEKILRRRAPSERFYYLINQILKDSASSGLVKIGKIIRAQMANPRFLANRYALGAIRRLAANPHYPRPAHD